MLALNLTNKLLSFLDKRKFALKNLGETTKNPRAFGGSGDGDYKEGGEVSRVFAKIAPVSTNQQKKYLCRICLWFVILCSEYFKKSSVFSFACSLSPARSFINAHASLVAWREGRQHDIQGGGSLKRSKPSCGLKPVIKLGPIYEPNLEDNTIQYNPYTGVTWPSGYVLGVSFWKEVLLLMRIFFKTVINHAKIRGCEIFTEIKQKNTFPHITLNIFLGLWNKFCKKKIEKMLWALFPSSLLGNKYEIKKFDLIKKCPYSAPKFFCWMDAS